MSSHDQLKQAIVESVEHGAFPDSEVSSTELPPSLLPALLADLQKARDEVKVANRSHCIQFLLSDPVKIRQISAN